ncbi:hypothetical protein SAMN05880501_101166 [Ureibacillus xyleni]|uniref:SbsA Ig-like domain-containing protein n=1 Tax=Ureibacillus xyleni TaxID=614648 RepID=A0A285R9U1_9BACL|nr:hypothetical protein [Ureibacillus xyleni]SOB90469.1 hypothetical protein SAMN05880501_101166 [Ureibacillus xyleni]
MKAKELDNVLAESKFEKVKIVDTTIPAVDKIVQVSPSVFDVVFSEPITAASAGAVDAAFSINKGSYSFTADTRIDVNTLGTNVVRITTNGKLPEGDYTLNIGTGLVDYAGFKVLTQDVPFKAGKDTSAISAEVTKVVGNQVFVKFNKPVVNFDADTNTNLKYFLDFPSNNSFASTSVDTDPDTQNGIIVTFNQPVTPGAHKLVISYVKADGTVIEDGFENKFAATTLNFNVSADNVAPTATASFNKETGRIEVKFSEKVDGADSTASYELTDASGAKVELNSATVKANSSELVYELTPAKTLEGTYSLKIKADKITDRSVEQNKLAETTLSLGVADGSAPQVLGAVYGGASNQKILVQFSEAMRTSGEGSILDKSLYEITGAGNLSKIKGASVALGKDNKSVVITLPSDYTSAPFNTGNIVVGKVADASGNFAALANLDAVATSDATPSVLAGGSSSSDIHTDVLANGASVVLTSADTIEFYIEGHQANVDGTKLTYNDVTPQSISTSHVVVDNGDKSGKLAATKVVAKFAKGTFGTAAVDGDLEFTATGAVTTQLGTAGQPGDADSLTVVGGGIVDKTAPVIVKDLENNTLFNVVAMDLFDNTDFADGFAFTDIASETNDGIVDTIRIKVSEDVDAASISTTTFTVEGFKVIAAYSDDSKRVIGDTTAADGEYINLIVVPTTAKGTGVEPTVTLKSAIKDVAGNELTSFTTKAIDWADAQVVKEEFSADEKTVTLTLSEEVKVASGKTLLDEVSVSGGVLNIVSATLVDGNKLVITADAAFGTEVISVSADTLIETGSSSNNSAALSFTLTNS